jgi:hypothetical protein
MLSRSHARHRSFGGYGPPCTCIECGGPTGPPGRWPQERVRSSSYSAEQQLQQQQQQQARRAAMADVLDDEVPYHIEHKMRLHTESKKVGEVEAWRPGG